MSIEAPINRILPYSVVDGPGNRVAVFVQGCNLHCAYCHNPETQRLCDHCGACVAACPAGALEMRDGRVRWQPEKCVRCDRCLQRCERFASPKVRWMSPDEVMAKVGESMPFIRGLTVSGGECALYPAFLEALFRRAHDAGLTCLMDSNGAVDLTLQPSLLEVCDGVMLDVKAWDAQVFRALTGGDAGIVKKNLSALAAADKLEELRIVVVEGLVDADDCIDGIARLLGPELTARQRLKLIRFRPFGVRGALERAPQPPMALMRRLEQRAAAAGFTDILVI